MIQTMLEIISCVHFNENIYIFLFSNAYISDVFISSAAHFQKQMQHEEQMIFFHSIVSWVNKNVVYDD